MKAPESGTFLTREECAAWLRMEPRQVDRLGVPVIRLGRKTRLYDPDAVRAWLAHVQAAK